MSVITVGEALSRTRKILEGRPDSEAEQLLQAAWRQEQEMTLTRARLYSLAREPLPPEVERRLDRLARERVSGTPLQHLTGVQVFLDHEFKVTPDVLIPRPETEVLAVTALELLAAGPRPRLGIEIGLGSGALSVTLLSAVPALKMVASEISPAAIAVAQENSRAILATDGDGRLVIVRPRESSEVLEPVLQELGDQRADFLISNPPYLSGAEEAEAEVVAHEPEIALFAPSWDPLHFYRKIEEDAPLALKSGGHVFLELAHERASEVLAMFSGPDWREVRLVADLTGRQRVLVARLASEAGGNG